MIYFLQVVNEVQLDIKAAVQTALIICLIGIAISLWLGVRLIRRGKAVTFFRIRHQRVSGGWRLIAFGITLGSFSIFLSFFAEPVAYHFLPPSPSPSLTPTITLTPTVTLTPTITLSPTITLTPLVSDTPTASPTPYLPIAVESQFTSKITPHVDAIFSPISFSKRYINFEPVNPATTFQNPVGHLYGSFTYDNMIPGVQWSALWYRNGKLVFFETKPWDGVTGGAGYTDWNPPPEEWLAGEYLVTIFVGMEWKVSGAFTVEGAPAAPTITHTPFPVPTSTIQP